MTNLNEKYNGKPQKVALVHYWLTGMRGGEKVLESLCRLYPDADIFTHVYDERSVSEVIKRHKVTTTFINRLPFAKTKYQTYLPLMPLALEQLDLRGYDLVISSESGPAKGVVVDPDATHICYCHSPMRYVWDMYHDYLSKAGRIKRLLAAPLLHYLKLYDQASSARVDHFIANSSYIAKRIEKCYRRKATVIHPPVDTERFKITDQIGDYYLLLGQLVPYKRADLAVEAFAKNGKRLVVVGDGECRSQIEMLAKGHSNIEIIGRQSNEQITRLYSECKALIFPGIEDFGIVPLEAIASGRPVIAFRKGGILDTVKPGENGVFFDAASAESLNESIKRFESSNNYDNKTKIRKSCEDFKIESFEKKIKKYISTQIK